MRRRLVSLALAAPLAALVACGGGDVKPRTEAERVTDGAKTYASVCATCHGANLRGTAMGPPMIDPVFAPSQHPDAAFYDAVEKGVQPHGHFKVNYGPMPPVLTLDRDAIANVLAYVRSEQRKAGIE